MKYLKLLQQLSDQVRILADQAKPPTAVIATKKPEVHEEEGHCTGAVTSSAAHFIPYGPTAYLTSTGFVSSGQWMRFIKIVLKRRGVLEARAYARVSEPT